MPKVTWTQTNFNGGEWSPMAYGRFDLDQYRKGLAECVNYMPTQQGGLTRRPGTRYVATVKDSSKQARLQRFEFSVTQAYVLEFGDEYVRFYTNDGQLQNAGVPVEVATPYGEADLWLLSFCQSADTLYIFHPDFVPRKLQRVSAYVWTLTTISFLDGPYLPVNVTSTTLTPSGTTGDVTVTASSTAGINGGAGFLASDVGRVLRIKCGGVWLWGTIKTFTDSTHVVWTVAATTGSLVPYTATATANVSGGSVFSVSIADGGSGYGVKPPAVTFGGPGSGAVAYASLTNGVVTAITVAATGSGYSSAPTVTLTAPTAIVPSTTTFWRLGLWNSVDGYPSCGVFHQDRLVLSGNAQYPSRLDASNVGDYESFAPTLLDGTVIDSNAMSFSLSSNAVNVIRWLVSDEWGLLAGTAGGEWIISPSTTQTALTPTNVSAKQLSNYGSSVMQPVRVGKATLFAQRTERKLREFFYYFTNNTFQALDISLLSEHLTVGGLKQMAVQLAPQQIVWVTRNDGLLVGITYDRDQQVCGWHQHPLGGYSNSTQAIDGVSDVALNIGTNTTAPSVDGQQRAVGSVHMLRGQADSSENGIYVIEYSSAITDQPNNWPTADSDSGSGSYTDDALAYDNSGAPDYDPIDSTSATLLSPVGLGSHEVIYSGWSGSWSTCRVAIKLNTTCQVASGASAYVSVKQSRDAGLSWSTVAVFDGDSNGENITTIDVSGVSPANFRIKIEAVGARAEVLGPGGVSYTNLGADARIMSVYATPTASAENWYFRKLRNVTQDSVWLVASGSTYGGKAYKAAVSASGFITLTQVSGYSDSGLVVGAIEESVAIIPSPNIQRDEVWLLVNRVINGATVRTVEVMSKPWENGDTPEFSNFLDCSAEYSGAATTTITGLTWLVGQTVGVLADGATHPDCVVDASGCITLQRPSSVVQVGLRYKSRVKTLSIEAGGGDGPSQGKIKRVWRVVVRFFQSLGLNMGSDTPGVSAYPQPFRTSADPMGAPPDLFTGDKRWSYEGTWDLEGKIYFETSDPLPSNITMLMVQMETQDAQ